MFLSKLLSSKDEQTVMFIMSCVSFYFPTLFLKLKGRDSLIISNSTEDDRSTKTIRHRPKRHSVYWVGVVYARPELGGWWWTGRCVYLGSCWFPLQMGFDDSDGAANDMRIWGLQFDWAANGMITWVLQLAAMSMVGSMQLLVYLRMVTK